MAKNKKIKIIKFVSIILIIILFAFLSLSLYTYTEINKINDKIEIRNDWETQFIPISDISMTEIKNIFEDSIHPFAVVSDINSDYQADDNVFQLYSNSDIEKVLSNIEYPKYNLFYDCDDYVITTMGETKKNLQGFPIAFAKVKLKENEDYHAINFFIDENKNMKVYEPQLKIISIFDKELYSAIYSVRY
jgi:flagella basal body P-ring formation protein FlgA